MKIDEIETLALIFEAKYSFSTVVNDMGIETIIFRQTSQEPFRQLTKHQVMMMALNYKSYYKDMNTLEQGQVLRYLERTILNK